MARPTRTFALLLAVHLAALSVSAIPSPASLQAATGVRESADDGVSRVVRPVLDAAGRVLVSTSAAAWRLTTPAQPLVRRYVSTLGLGQTWNMFASPPRGSQFLRLRHFVAGAAVPSGAPSDRVVSEIVFPAAPMGTFRGFAAYWQSHRDKAAANAIEAYLQDRDRRGAGGPADARAPDARARRSLVPLVRYYHRRFEEQLPAPEVLVRSEAWYGWATSPHRGARRAAESRRAEVLARYSGGAVSEAPGVTYSPVDSEEVEADIRWTLLYVEGR